MLSTQEICAHVQLKPRLHLVSVMLKGKKSYQSVGEYHPRAAGVAEQLAHLPDGERHNHQYQHEANECKQGQRQREGLSWEWKDRNRLRRCSEEEISNPGPPSLSCSWLSTFAKTADANILRFDVCPSD